MAVIRLILIVTALVLQLFTAKIAAENERPIIGILAQVTDGVLSDMGDTYIQQPYASFLEQAGARVVPIKTDKDDDYYQFLFDRINGMLMPGGGASIINSGYANAARLMYDLAVKATDNGDPFPIWGTCLGFQQLTNLTAGADLLVKCEGVNYSLPLQFITDARKSRLFHDIDDDVLDDLQKYPLTYNHHQYCMTKQIFENHDRLDTFYRMITTNKDLGGLTFVSTMEAYDYPFYGAQWHAEKNNFFWQTNELINHSLSAVKLSQHMANFFVQQTRQSNHHFQDAEEEGKYLIQNQNPVYLAAPYFYSAYIYNYTQNDTIFYGLDLTACAGRLQLALILLLVIFVAASVGVVLRQHCLAHMKGQPSVIVLADSKLLKKVKQGWNQQDSKNFKMPKDGHLLSNMHLHTIDMGII